VSARNERRVVDRLVVQVVGQDYGLLVSKSD
jgi:hypothetical protein